MNYINEDYQQIIDNYRRTGNKNRVSSELKFLARGDVPTYDKETFMFLDEIMQIANEHRHEDIVANCTEVANQMKKTSGNAFAYTSVLEDALGGKYDCVKLIKESMENGQYQSAITKIIYFLEQEKDFSIAEEVAKAIDNSNISNATANKEDVAFYFIDRMKKVIDNMPIEKKGLGMFLRYTCEGWGKGSKFNDPYVHYNDFVIKYDKIRKRRK